MTYGTPRYRELYNEGRLYLNCGRYQEALRTFETARREWENSYAYFGIGRAYYGLKEYSAALQNFEMAYKMYASNVQAAHWIAKSLGKLKRYNEAETQFKTVLRTIGKEPINFYREVSADFEEMKTERDGITKQPKTTKQYKSPKYQALYNEGKMYLNSGRYRDALNSFETARLEWENSYVYFGIGRAHYGLEQYADALQNFETAYKMYTSNVPAAHWIAKSLGKLKRYNEADIQFKTVLQRLENGPANFYQEVKRDFDEMKIEQSGGEAKHTFSTHTTADNNSVPRIIINGNVTAPINIGGVLATDEAVINRADIDSKKTNDAADSNPESYSLLSRLFTAKKSVCPKCGKKIKDTQKFCNNCGEPLQ